MSFEGHFVGFWGRIGGIWGQFGVILQDFGGDLGGILVTSARFGGFEGNWRMVLLGGGCGVVWKWTFGVIWG